MLTEVEQAAIEAHLKSVDLAADPRISAEKDSVYLALRLLFEAGRSVRAHRTILDRSNVTVKYDGSPATDIEQAIELRLRKLLASLDTEVVVVGEETGGDPPGTGLAVAIDPIDGTWAFLTETETYSTTLALINNREPALGMISNPVTGEIAYATAGGGSRLVRLSVFGEPMAAYSLPSRSVEDGLLLVNVHPSQTAGAVMESLYRAWSRRDVAIVRSPGGSPAWALVEAARGHFVYVNLWSKRAAAAYDLTAGTFIVRQAGGEVTDLEGRPIEALEHAGPFLAGLDRSKMDRLAELVREGIAHDPTF